MPRTHRHPPTVAHRRTVRRSFEGVAGHAPGRVLSPDEKRELILAHHAARTKRGKPHPAWGWGYYVGIAASCLVILTGWWLTLGSSLRYQAQPSTESLTGIIKNSVDEFQASWRAGADGRQASQNDVNTQIQAAKTQYQQAIIRERALEAATKELQQMNQQNATSTQTVSSTHAQ